jgi:phosphate starvation-inducible protein PhoH
MELLRAHELVFATGPAGTGKTYLAVAMAISMLAAKRVKKIVLTVLRLKLERSWDFYQVIWKIR